jgi:hypothetical protein
MPSRSLIQVTAGSGTKMATSNYTDGADSKHDEVVVHGEQHLPTYFVVTGSVSAATNLSHLIQVMAGSSLHLYIRRVWVYQQAAITTAALVPFSLIRLTTAGTGGTSLTASIAPLDTGDSAAGAASMSLPTAKGTEGTTVGPHQVAVPVQTAPTSGQTGLLAFWDFSTILRGKALRIPSGTANGICVSNRAAAAGLSVYVGVEFSEAPY